MGNVSKPKPGRRTNRAIQDLRANSVNEAARVPERQVLPRGIDHARDMAHLLDIGTTDPAEPRTLPNRTAENRVSEPSCWPWITE
jgi:hypothetical protein